MDRTRTAVRTVLSGLAAGVLVALGAAPALAHVTLTPSSTTAGDTAVVRVEVPHGCAGSATTELAVRMPAQVTEVTVTSTDRWVAEEVDGTITYRTDAPLPDGREDTVEFSVLLPVEVGTTLVFPGVQRCGDGEAAWIEIGADAAARDGLERPAPVIVVTGAASDRLMTVGAAGVLAAGCLGSGGVLLVRRRRA
ncbi:YcnI family protein [Nocardioides zhouii]|uniref:DUF1775 domain-containing protein n=1 Tax=Nocardioides zhouii TaxID=1168729 RepID=A0A4Q2T956_9ACTN|nr:YcnI family protein [Nocardioides zhouii]RYC14843.1 DUF1775 domain-containing protein [Nocardioides zhouii]